MESGHLTPSRRSRNDNWLAHWRMMHPIRRADRRGLDRVDLRERGGHEFNPVGLGISMETVSMNTFRFPNGWTCELTQPQIDT